MSFERARAVADAVLFEGYALYPYRPTAVKNQLRWQFGVLAPRAVSEASGADPWWLELQTLVEADGAAEIAGKLRFLRLRRRRIETPEGAPLSSLDVDGRLLIPWDEGEITESDFTIDGRGTIAVSLEGDETLETIYAADGRAVARVRRSRAPLSLQIRAARQPTGVPRLWMLIVRVENLTACVDPRARRDDTLALATLGTHLFFTVANGAFVSLMDPPPHAERAAASCRNVGTYPVLAGEPGRYDLLLASPIILYDHPRVAPESPGNLFDATEIDEILALRTLLLTDEEKRLARATDEHVAALIDRVERMPEESWRRLHGTFRAPEGTPEPRPDLARGSRVRLRPGARRSDAQDMFLAGRVATVHEIKEDVDGRACLAVTIDDDPAAELHDWLGRYHYFYADEVEPLA